MPRGLSTDGNMQRVQHRIERVEAGYVLHSAAQFVSTCRQIAIANVAHVAHRTRSVTGARRSIDHAGVIRKDAGIDAVFPSAIVVLLEDADRAVSENDTPFTPHMLRAGNEADRAGLLELWPVGKFPVLRDGARDRIIPESTIIIEYLDRYYPERTRFIPADFDLAWQARLRDRFYDLYVHLSAQNIIRDRLRPRKIRMAWNRRRRGCGRATT
jgi:Glutathione S-transferase, N-terminal domain